jgi:translocation and assembly module TamB
MIGGSALTVGQYLSPRLFLSYGVGLFEPGDVITLRYKLSEALAVQTQRGPEDTRGGNRVSDREIGTEHLFQAARAESA